MFFLFNKRAAETVGILLGVLCRGNLQPVRNASAWTKAP
jgi:hypothetical protein